MKNMIEKIASLFKKQPNPKTNFHLNSDIVYMIVQKAIRDKDEGSQE